MAMKGEKVAPLECVVRRKDKTTSREMYMRLECVVVVVAMTGSKAVGFRMRIDFAYMWKGNG